MRVDTDIIVIVDGDQYPIEEVDASCELLESVDGEPAVLETIHDGTYYRGPVTITPSSERQIIETAQKTLAQNIVVEPVPQQYGLITWNGQKLTVS